MSQPPNLADGVAFVLKHRKKIASGLYLLGGLLESLAPTVNAAATVIRTKPCLPRPTPKRRKKGAR